MPLLLHEEVFRKLRKNLAVVTVDEGHCTSEWYKLLLFQNLSHTFPDTSGDGREVIHMPSQSITVTIIKYC